jgi:hypothetical protein
MATTHKMLILLLEEMVPMAAVVEHIMEVLTGVAV